MKTRRLALVLPFLAAGLALGRPCRAQCLDWSPDFTALGANDEVIAIASFDDGTGPALYAAGAFLAAGGANASYIARWDGAAWAPVGQGDQGVDDHVYALTVFDDGTGPALYVGGNFTTAGGIVVNHVARWNGTAWSALGSGTSSNVYSLGVFDDGSGPALFAGGAFTAAGGTGASHIAKWDGSVWSPLGSGLDLGAFALAVYDDGSGPALFAGGNFTTAGGAPANRLAKWDGSQWSPVGDGVDAIVNALAVFDDTSGAALYVGGAFTHSGSAGANHLAMWNGSVLIGAGAGLDGTVRALHVYGEGLDASLYAGGDFYYVQPGGPKGLAKWNGGGWFPAGSGLPLVDALGTFDDGTGAKLVVGGRFTATYGTYPHSGIQPGYIALWDGTDWTALGTGLDSGFGAACVFDDGSGPALYVGGAFHAAGTIHANGIARWDGAHWTPLGAGTDGSVSVLKVFDDGTGPALYAGGSFSFAGEVPAKNIARWNGTSWTPLGSGVDGYNLGLGVSDLAVFDDGTGPALYAGGHFRMAGGAPANNIARWDGSSWTPLGSGTADGFNPGVAALAVFDEGSGPILFASGGFGTAGGVPASHVARWDGSVWSPVGTGTNGGTWALAVFDDGTGPALYAGGYLDSTGGTVARWDGVAWSELAPTIHFYVYAFAVHDDGTGRGPALYAGGDSSLDLDHLARWDGSSWSQIADASVTTVHSLAAFEASPGAGADLYVGMSREGNQSPSSGMARWVGCGRPGIALCFGDGSGSACPCANYGGPRRGCQNSAGTGGALLATSGWASLAHDSLRLTSTGELPSVLSIFLQGSTEVAPILFGDGLRCAGGALKRMYKHSASGGVVVAPQGSDLPVSQRSAAMGSPITAFGTRLYQVYYRDPNAAFCPNPPGNGWNASNAIRLQWLP